MSIALRRALFLLISLVALSSVTSCDSGGTGSDSNAPDTLIPLTEGNRWVMKPSSGTTSDSITAEVVGDSIRVKRFEGGGNIAFNVTLNVLLSEQSDGFLLRSPGLSNVMFLEFPVEAGSTYNHTDANGNTYQVSVSKKSVSVEYGTFESCLEYTIRGTENRTLRATLTVKPGFGPVRWSSDVFPMTNEGPVELTSTNVSR